VDTLLLVWRPLVTGGSQPRVKAYKAGGGIVHIPDMPLTDGVGMSFTLEDFDKNRELVKTYLAAGKQWSCEQVERPAMMKKAPTPKRTTSPKRKATGHPVRPLNRAEIMDVLDKHRIVYRQNEKSETLFRKLPDDIKRSSKLVKPIY